MSHVRFHHLLVAALCCGFAVSAFAQQSQNQLQPQDKQFLEHLAKDSQGEVQLSQMVASKTSNPQVKEFAQKMMHDHTLLDHEVQQVMQKHGLQMPPAMTAEQKQLEEKLQGLSGSQFDQAFMKAQVQGHEQDVQAVTPIAQQEKQLQPTDPSVAELAQEALPVLRDHLQLAKQVASEVGVSTTAQK